MAKRYRYSFTKKKEAIRGKASVVLAIASVVGFLMAVTLQVLGRTGAHLVGAFCLLGALFALFGFLEGLLSFREKDREHFTGVVGSISCGLLLIGWMGLYLSGV